MSSQFESFLGNPNIDHFDQKYIAELSISISLVEHNDQLLKLEFILSIDCARLAGEQGVETQFSYEYVKERAHALHIESTLVKSVSVTIFVAYRYVLSRCQNAPNSYALTSTFNASGLTEHT